MIKQARAIGIVLLLVGIMALGAPSAGLFAQDDSALFEDDFSSDQGWLDESDGAITRDDAEEVLVWQTDNESAQRALIPLDVEAGSVKFAFRVTVTDAGASGGVFIGLAEALSGALDNADAPTGVFVALNHTATGMTVAYPWITYADQAAQMAADLDDDTTTIDLGELGTWLNVELVIEAGTWTLSVADDTGDQIGEISGAMNAEHAAYTHLIVFYEGADWEALSGQLDDVVVMAGAADLDDTAAEVPADPCVISTDQLYVSVRLGPGLNRGERFSLPSEQEFTVTGWDETSDGLLWWQIAMPDAGDNRTWVQQDHVTAAGACDLDSIAASASAIVAPAPGGTAGGDASSADTSGSDTSSDSASSGDTGSDTTTATTTTTTTTATSVQLGIGSSAACVPMDGRWSANWLENQHLGCPVNPPHYEGASFQSFLSGRVIHRQATGEIIILYSSGAYTIYLDTWANEPVPCTLANSWGSLAYLWCIDPNVQQWLGATTGGLGDALSFTVQDFQSGMILWTDQTGNVILYPNYTWLGF